VVASAWLTTDYDTFETTLTSTMR